MNNDGYLLINYGYDTLDGLEGCLNVKSYNKKILSLDLVFYIITELEEATEFDFINGKYSKISLN